MKLFNLLDIYNLIKKKKLEESTQDIIKDIEESTQTILKKYSDKKKNIGRKQKIDDKKIKYDINDVLKKEEIKKLPKWVKEFGKEVKVTGNTKKTLITPNGKKYHLDNKLNDLSGAEWSYFLRSVINSRYQTSGKEGYAHDIRKVHPSPKPPQLMQDIIKFFTKENEYVFDYFMGVGGTLLGASLSNRNALGIELNKNYISAYIKASKKLNLKVQHSIHGDALDILQKGEKIKNFLKNNKFSLIAIDPPYGDMMSREKTGESIKKLKSNKATPFTKSKKDFGNMEWNLFMKKLILSIEKSLKFLKEKGHIVVFIKDLQPKNGNINLLHADIIQALNRINNLNYLGMKIWADESINLYPYGYPFSFVSNQLHQYIMIFKKKS